MTQLVLLLVSAEVLAADTPERLGLLKLFRSEFVSIVPGQGRYPQQQRIGRSRGGRRRERPVHQVAPQPFQIAKYEVTQELWQAVVGSNPSRWKGPRNSVEMLSFDQAEAFCRQVTCQMREAGLIDANQIVRLPSEAEWEYAARAGTKTLYSFGDEVRQLDPYGWYTGNAAGNDPPVGAKQPNPWGLYDMHGYLWEWCADDWHDDYRGAPTDGSAWLDDGRALRKVLRGGSWKDPADQLTSSYRRGAPRNLRDDAVGLRCVLANVGLANVSD